MYLLIYLCAWLINFTLISTAQQQQCISCIRVSESLQLSPSLPPPTPLSRRPSLTPAPLPLAHLNQRSPTTARQAKPQKRVPNDVCQGSQASGTKVRDIWNDHCKGTQFFGQFFGHLKLISAIKTKIVNFVHLTEIFWNKGFVWNWGLSFDRKRSWRDKTQLEVPNFAKMASNIYN